MWTVFLRRRGILTFVTVNFVAAAAVVVVGAYSVRLAPRGDWSVAFALVAPVIPACFLSLVVLPKAISAELQRLRSVLGTELIAAGLSLLITVVALGTAAVGGVSWEAAMVVVRNCAGLFGLAIIGTATLGPMLGWLVPTAAVFLPAVLLADPTRFGPDAFTFVFGDSGSSTATLAAVVYLSLGIATIVVMRGKGSGAARSRCAPQSPVARLIKSTPQQAWSARDDLAEPGHTVRDIG